MTDVVHVLLGAALVAIGILAAAIADRIRGVRLMRGTSGAATQPRSAVPVHTAVPGTRSVKPRGARASVPRTSSSPSSDRSVSGDAADANCHAAVADEVIAALVASGHPKPLATEAVWGCGQPERESVESWTLAALRRCVRGVVS
jgi:hypothetical protein